MDDCDGTVKYDNCMIELLKTVLINLTTRYLDFFDLGPNIKLRLLSFKQHCSNIICI